DPVVGYRLGVDALVHQGDVDAVPVQRRRPAEDVLQRLRGVGAGVDLGGLVVGLLPADGDRQLDHGDLGALRDLVAVLHADALDDHEGQVPAHVGDVAHGPQVLDGVAGGRVPGTAVEVHDDVDLALLLLDQVVHEVAVAVAGPVAPLALVLPGDRRPRGG